MKAIRELINNKAKRNCPVYPEENIDTYYDSSSDEETKEERIKMNSDNDKVNNFGLIYRSYTPACDKDHWNILCGRCPDYALDWSNEMNQLHWPAGHDFINGFENVPKREEYKPEMMDEFNRRFERLFEENQFDN